LDIRRLVVGLENSLINSLTHYQVNACGKREAPGVYVGEAKIAALGLHVHKGCAYHGFSLNVAMDLSPFEKINPCGFSRLPITQLSSWASCSMDNVKQVVRDNFIKQFQYESK
jgi:lipoyl(octanoyl) transferase